MRWEASLPQIGYDAGYSGTACSPEHAGLSEPGNIRRRDQFNKGVYDGELQRGLERLRAIGDERMVAHYETQQRRRAAGGIRSAPWLEPGADISYC